MASSFPCICPYVAFFFLLLITVVYARDLLSGDTIQDCMYNMVFLMTNIRCLKHVENKKNWIKTLI